MLKRDLSKDTTTYNLTLENFDMAFRLDYTLRNIEPQVYENIDQYVDLRVTQNIYEWSTDQHGQPMWNKTKIKTTLGPCTAPRVGLEANTTNDYLGIGSIYLCPTRTDFQIQGITSAKVAKFIQIAVRECSQ